MLASGNLESRLVILPYFLSPLYIARYKVFPRIFIELLSTPEVIRTRRSLRRRCSICLSSLDRSCLMKTCDAKDERFPLARRTEITSLTLNILIKSGRVLLSSNRPSLRQLLIDWVEIELSSWDRRDPTTVKSWEVRKCLAVPARV